MIYLKFFSLKRQSKAPVIVGPVRIGWTYGKLRVFLDDGFVCGFVWIPTVGDLICLKHISKNGIEQKNYYSDLLIIEIKENDPEDKQWVEREKKKILSGEQFEEKFSLT